MPSKGISSVKKHELVKKIPQTNLLKIIKESLFLDNIIYEFLKFTKEKMYFWCLFLEENSSLIAENLLISFKYYMKFLQDF